MICGRFSCQNGVTRTFWRTYSLGFMEYFTPTLFMKSAHRSMRSTAGPTHAADSSMMPKRSFGKRSNTLPITMVCRNTSGPICATSMKYGLMASSPPARNAGLLRSVSDSPQANSGNMKSPFSRLEIRPELARCSVAGTSASSSRAQNGSQVLCEQDTPPGGALHGMVTALAPFLMTRSSSLMAHSALCMLI